MRNGYLGVSFTLLSALIYAFQAASIKKFNIGLSVPVIVFSQSLVALILILPIILYKKHQWQVNLLKPQFGVAVHKTLNLFCPTIEIGLITHAARHAIKCVHAFTGERCLVCHNIKLFFK
jgi:membrane protein YdbS with pleckstrin-like domain